METRIRKVRETDLDRVLRLNDAAVPAVNRVDRETMLWFAEHAAYFRVSASEDRIAAFLIGLRPGLDYASPNYRWFARRFEDFLYVDRVAVAPATRRQGVASRLYADFQRTMPTTVPLMTCEVNIVPPNEGSLRFHRQLGFEQLGTQAVDGGEKRVALLAKRL